MKSYFKTRVIINVGIFITISLFISQNFTSYVRISEGNTDYINNITSDEKEFGLSTISQKIHIINNSGWVAFRDAGYCTGEGTYSDPYVIEDLVIDAEHSGNCILIENSDVYFRIENCSLYNSTEFYDYSIVFSNVNNSLIINNSITLNYNGIYLYQCNNNTISQNTLNKIEAIGIGLSGSSNHSISGNTFNGCSLTISGVVEDHYGSHKISSTNLVNGKPLYYYTNIIDLNPNNFTNAGQIILFNCNDTIISNVDISRVSTGISLFNCDNSKILGSNIKYSSRFGIYLNNCNFINISKNNVINNDEGLCFYKGTHATISDNIMNNNSQGMWLYQLSYSDISGNNVSDNRGTGIHLNNGNNDVVSENTVTNNGRGIYVQRGSYNTFSGNKVVENSYYGIDLYHTHHNEITGNKIFFNINSGINLWSDCNNNEISRNIIIWNDKGISITLSDYNHIYGNLLIFTGDCIVQNQCEGNIVENNHCRQWNLFLDLLHLAIIQAGTLLVISASFFFIYKLIRKRKIHS